MTRNNDGLRSVSIWSFRLTRRRGSVLSLTSVKRNIKMILHSRNPYTRYRISKNIKNRLHLLTQVVYCIYKIDKLVTHILSLLLDLIRQDFTGDSSQGLWFIYFVYYFVSFLLRFCCCLNNFFSLIHSLCSISLKLSTYLLDVMYGHVNFSFHDVKLTRTEVDDHILSLKNLTRL